jgi:hypothetical protein
VVDRTPQPGPLQGLPLYYIVRCALEGCRWRVLLPAHVCIRDAGEQLARAGWAEDSESDGFICGVHGRGRVDA